MIRPEVKALFWRWREVIFAVGLGLVGLWLGWRSFGIVQWIGYILAAVGAGGAYAAWQKMRFTGSGDGPGVVTVAERRIIYMGPEDGGVVDLDVLVQLDLTPSKAWRLTSRDGAIVDISADATGAEALYDLFLTLPGIKVDYLLSVLERTRPAPVTVWMAPGHRPYKQVH